MGYGGRSIWGESHKFKMSRVPLTQTRQLTSEAKEEEILMIKFKRMQTLIMAAAMSLSIGSVAKAASYTVTPGDSLYLIGKLFNTSASTIMQTNKLSGTTIYPGQVLNISCTTYTVQSGDSLYLIAQKFGVSLDSLRWANNIWTNYIYSGQILNIPGTASNSGQASNYSSSAQKGVISYTASDVDLLARLINAEAQGESYTAKVAVGAVVVNRVQDGRFPNTIGGVIYEKSGGYYQFTPVLNGWINKPAPQECVNAAYEALHGTDPTNGALYYFDDSTTNKWLWSKTIALRVGKMVFSYY